MIGITIFNVIITITIFVDMVIMNFIIGVIILLLLGPNVGYSENQSLPKYAGFERDVFKAVVGFFEDEQKCPLVPRHLLGVFKKTVGK